MIELIGDVLVNSLTISSVELQLSEFPTFLCSGIPINGLVHHTLLLISMGHGS